MAYVDFILNLAGLLIWFKWLEKNPQPNAPGLLMAVSHRRVRPAWTRFIGPMALALLIGIRAVIYWQIGSGVHWVARIPLGIISLPFRSDDLGRMLTFSTLSFGYALLWLYMTLLIFSALNRRRMESDPVQRVVQALLGGLGRLPVLIQWSLPFAGVFVIWLVLYPGLKAMGILPGVSSFGSLAGQGGVMGAAVYLVWKYVLAGLLILYLLNSYIYFGASPLWTFIDRSGRNLLKGLSGLPLRAGRIDLAPMVMLVLVIAAAEAIRWGLGLLYEKVAFPLQ